MEPRKDDSSDSDNEIQFIEPLSMSGTLKPRDLTTPDESSKVNYNIIGERIAGFISAFITVCLILGLHGTHLLFVFLSWMESRIKEGYCSTDTIGIALWIGLGFMSVFVVMGLWSFTMALRTDNRVRPELKNKTSGEDLTSQKEEPPSDDQKVDYRVKRWCKKCNQEKPIRAHHCSVCNVCVLRMDHHCPWINNCVGYRNHGHYLRFLFYVTLAMITGLVLMASRLATYKGRYMYWGQRNGRFSLYLTDEMMQMAFLVADLVGCGILSLLIGLLLAVQLVNVSHGHTTIESLEITQCERDIRRQRRRESTLHEDYENIDIPFPYDLGFDKNLEAVFGGNRWLWPFPLPISMNPLPGSSPNGRTFETRPDALMNGQWPLPTKDPLLLSSRTGSLNDGAGYVVTNVNYGGDVYTSKMIDVEMANNSANDCAINASKGEHQNLPWVEKYRPSLLNEVVAHKEIISTLDKFISQGKLPHLLFYGPPGTGKTSTANALTHNIFGKNYHSSMVLELNASDERGIDVVREQIKTFAATKTFNKTATGSNDLKLIILDEADAMTSAAQNALRRVMEKYVRNVRFIIICNYVGQIIPPLQSRCTRFRFAPLPLSCLQERMDHVIQQEGLNVSLNAKKALIRIANGDMRRVLNVLQAASAAYHPNEIDEDAIYAVTAAPHPADIQRILDWLTNDQYDISQSFSSIQKLQREKSLALSDVIREIFDISSNSPHFKLSVPSKIYLTKKLADIEYKLAQGATEMMQLAALVSAFQLVRAIQ